MKKLLALLLTLCLVIGMVPLTASAEGEDDSGDAQQSAAQKLAESLGTDNAKVESNTVTLTKDVSLTKGVTVEGTVILDLAGKTISASSSWLSDSGNDFLVAVKRGGNLTIKDSGKTGAISSGSVKGAMCAVKMTIKDENAGEDNAVLTVDGGTLTGYFYGIAGNGTRHGTEITINGGKVTSENGTGIYHPQAGTLTINEGEISGLTGVELRSGNLVMNGGTIKSTAGEYKEEANGGGTTVTGAALAISQHTTKKAISVTISGGTLDGPKAFSQTNVQDEFAPPENITLKIESGEFKGDVKSDNFNNFISGGNYTEPVNPEYCAEDMAPLVGDDGECVIKNKNELTNSNYSKDKNGVYYASDTAAATENEASVTSSGTTTYYATLAEAIEKAKPGDTIKLVRDIENAMDTEGAPNGTAAYTIPAGVTLDGGGHKITASSNWKATSHPIIGVKGATTTIKNLTIDGSGKSGHGINVWSGSDPKANVKVENVTINNTATAGMVVNNSTVTASGLKTKGNVWGAVNVDKGASFTLTGTGNELKENVQVYSEDAGESGSKITVEGTGLKEVKSYEKNKNSGLKGYTYYTDDVSKLGEAYNATTNTVYEDADDALDKASTGETVQIVKNAILESGGATVDAGVTLQVPAGVKLTGDLINKGTIDLDGTIDGNVTNEGTIDYDGKITGTLTNQNGGKVEYPYVPPVIPTYKTTVEECEGGSVVASPSSAREGQKVTLTVKPQAGQELKSLKVTDKDGDAVTLTKVEGGYTFNMPKGGVTVTAVFGCDGTGDCPSKNFTDLGENQWYHEYMDYAVEKGLLEGTSPTTMEPNATLTRAQLAQILYNLEGKPQVQGDLDFTDVAEGKWYYAAILWANQEGVVDGMSPDTFAPNEDISRQDLALMLYRYAGEPTVTGDLDGFKDAGQVGDWAEEAITWAVEEGIIDGMTPTTLEPTGTATRAQAAAMLQRFLEG